MPRIATHAQRMGSINDVPAPQPMAKARKPASALLLINMINALDFREARERVS